VLPSFINKLTYW